MQEFEKIIEAQKQTIEVTEKMIDMSDKMIKETKEKIMWKTYSIFLTVFNLLFILLIILAL